MLHLILAVTLGAGSLPGFPRDAAGRISQPAIGLQLDGAPAVVVSAGDRLVAFRADGSSPPGFPFVLPEGEVAAGAPAAADMDGDRRPELALVTTSGRLFLWSGAGLVPGFPVQLGARARAGVSFADVDGDGKPELLVGDERGRVHAFKRSGAAARGFPISAGKAAVTSTVSSAPFAGGPSLAWGCEDGKVHAVSLAGKERPGFPLATAFAVTGAPVFVDLDDDGDMDLLVASQDFKLHAVDAAGQPLAGFPVTAGYRIYEAPAVADLDGDGRLDVIFASADGQLHAVDRAGQPLKGFPVRVGPRVFGGPAVGDIDRDGALEVAVASADGMVSVVNAAGRVLSSFPATLGESDVAASPLLFDLAGDGGVGIFVGTPNGRLHALRSARGGTAAVALPWPAPGRDPGRTGRYGPNPPAYKELKLTPAEPRAADTLKGSWRAVWLDAGQGEAVPAPRIEWLRNGKPVPGLEGKASLPPGTARRGERWRFSLTAPTGTLVADSAEVRVLDTPPIAPEARLVPAIPERGVPVKVVVTRPSTDADGDPVSYRIAWLLDGLETGVVGDTFPGDRLRRGLLLTARVVPNDGELDGPPALADARVANTPPGPLLVALEPEQPRRTDVLRARIVKPATDPDGDRLSYHYRWSSDGKPLPLPLSAAEVPPGQLRKHRKARVEVRAFDGGLEGPPAVAELEVQDSPPGAPRVEIRPARPRKGETLRALLLAPADDADGDALTYTFAWTRNGVPLPPGPEPREVAGALVSRGERYEVTVQASDGEAQGPRASASVVVVNTPPEPPRVAIEPRHPRGGEPLRLVVGTPARDADGDPVRLAIAWTRDGKPAGSTETLPAAAFRKHERIRLIVTPSDGQEAGPTVSDEVLVENAPPSAPEVAFAPERPTVGEPLRVVLKRPSVDPDGDRVTYRYRWSRDGAPALVPGLGGSMEVGWSTASEVPANLLAKGATWEVEVQAFDGEVHGRGGRATTTIQNTPPPRPELAFLPAAPRRGDGLSLAIRQPPDVDGDPVTWRFAWSRNGVRFEAPPDQSQIPRGVPRRGERWAVEAVALDGEAESAPARAEVLVADTAPGPVGVTLCEGPVPSGTVPEVRITQPASDADGDQVTYRYAWTLNGAPVPAATSARFTAPLKKRDVARVVVTPWDGQLAGPPTSAACAGRNTPPTAPVLALEPAAPTALSGVSVKVKAPATDHDGDPVTYRYHWSRDGLPLQLQGPAVGPGMLHHLERWSVEVAPFDGEEAGEAQVLAVTIANTPPPAPVVTLKPPVASAGAPLGCEVTVPERDADQEPVTVQRRWYRGERPEPVGDGLATLPAGLVRRGEHWRCEAWSFDGTSESGHVSAVAAIQNSPPTAPQVAIEPEVARVGDELACQVTVPSVDPDGDDVAYTFAWWRNDKPVPGASPGGKLPAITLAKGDKFRCTATPSDGIQPGPAGSATLQVVNSPPGPAKVRLSSATPTPSRPLRCELAQKSEDPDRDPIRYRYRWQRNGVVQPFADTSDEVPVRMLRSGDRWRCLVSPSDGELEGPESGSEEALVGPAN